MCVLPGLGTENTAAEIELSPSTATSREAIVKAAARLMMECERTLTALALRNAHNAKTSAGFFVDYAVSHLQKHIQTIMADSLLRGIDSDLIFLVIRDTNSNTAVVFEDPDVGGLYDRMLNLEDPATSP